MANARPVDPVHPRFIRAPPTFQSGTDLDIYLRRFLSYARAVNCPPDERSALLLSMLDDKALSGVTRVVANNPNIPFDELVAQLRRAEGYAQNSEKYVTELRSRRRLRGESIWDYHLDLHKIAAKAYPHDEAMRTGSLRESFISNLNDSYIASRLRELQNVNLEQLLDAAIMLQGCQQASAKQINFLKKAEVNLIESQRLDKLDQKFDTLTDLVGHLTLNINTLHKQATENYPRTSAEPHYSETEW